MLMKPRKSHINIQKYLLHKVLLCDVFRKAKLYEILNAGHSLAILNIAESSQHIRSTLLSFNWFHA